MSTPMRRELPQVVRLAAPIAAAHFGQVLLGFVDTAVVGRLGPSDLGAVGVGNSIYFAFAIFGGGIVLGLDPLIAQAIGADQGKRAKETVWQGVWLALLVGLPMIALAIASALSLEAFGIEAVTAAKARAYVITRSPAMLPYFVVTALSAYLQAVGKTRPLVIAAVVANLVNLPLDWLFVLGDEGLTRLGLPTVGAPSLGAAGAGLASSFVTLAQLAVVALAFRGAGHGGPVTRRLRLAALREALGVGMPIGLQRLAEVGVFSLTGLLMGRIGTLAVASHQVAMSFAAATFMVPLGISAAAAVRVGRFVGARDREGTRVAGLASMLVGGGFMAGCGVLLVAMPEALARVLTDDPAVIAASVPLLRVAAIFQISDGMQVVGAGALRGMGDTRAALYLNLVGHYGIGMPVGIALAFATSLGAVGLWWGLCAGLTAVAVALALRFVRMAARGVEPIAA
jgi:multidrug resistance protein, MATE family